MLSKVQTMVVDPISIGMAGALSGSDLAMNRRLGIDAGGNAAL